MAISRLLFAGHGITIPITDDDGVDFIVDYRTHVQVKCTGRRNASGSVAVGLENSRSSERRHGPRGRRGHVDVLLVYARDVETWWVIPAASVPHAGGITLGRTYDQWREAWDVFDKPPASSTRASSTTDGGLDGGILPPGSYTELPAAGYKLGRGHGQARREGERWTV